MSERAARTVKVTNRLGLHARPAMTFVDTASEFKCEVTVRRTDEGEAVDGKSIMQMMMLAATQGTELEIVAEGEAAEKAVEALSALVKKKFDEE